MKVKSLPPKKTWKDTGLGQYVFSAIFFVQFLIYSSLTAQRQMGGQLEIFKVHGENVEEDVVPQCRLAEYCHGNDEGLILVPG
jgi:hypothetical protein